MSGVQIPRSQTMDPDDRGNPLTVGEAQLALMVPVKYYDNQGAAHAEFVFVVGDTVYKDPAGEAWASKLKVMTDSLSTEIVSRAKSQLQSVVRQVLQEMGITGNSGRDDVDVLADGVDRDLSSTQ